MMLENLNPDKQHNYMGIISLIKSFKNWLGDLELLEDIQPLKSCCINPE